MKVLCSGNTKKQISFTKKTSIFLLITVIAIFSIYSCNKSENFTIGENFIDSQTNLQVLDTFKVNLSTVLLDSVATSGTKVALVGQYGQDNNDNTNFGAITSRSFFEFGYPNLTKVASTDVFDSASFILCYSKYYYGDTTKLMTISIQQTKKQIAVNSVTGVLYNTSKLAYSNILGTKTFYPRPLSKDTIVSIAANEFGKNIFDLVQKNSDIINTSSEFLEYIKGFAITPESAVTKSTNITNHAILGFSMDSKHVFFRMYYHTTDYIPEQKVLNITYDDNYKNFQFNNIDFDPSNSPLSNIKTSKNILSSAKTNNEAFMQGTVGLLTKVQFPTLGNLLLNYQWKILKAELVVYPVKASYSGLFKLPGQLYLYDTDKQNQINKTLTVNGLSSGKNIVSNLYVDQLYNEDTRYTFDITNFIVTQSSSSYFDYEHGILIGINQASIMSTFARLEISGNNPAVKLRLYYLTY